MSRIPKFFDDEDCPVREILDHVGDKWTSLILSNLVGGSLRFSEIKRRLPGISQRMLTETLRGLERNGILLRTVYPIIPPKVEYSLTPLGESLVPLVQALVLWSLEHRSEIHDARSTYDAEGSAQEFGVDSGVIQTTTTKPRDKQKISDE
ncbi:MAG: helix-turn-helix domain-containing protein [Nostoc sp.]|uniref:winged helix-turn-helix transcriptional regulator n=1 Tax=Nostoc sp. TaxID=1180 RepID=UPI002FFB8DEF